METNQPASVGCQSIKERLAGQHGAVGIVMIGRWLPIWMCKRDSRMGERISENNHGVGAGGDLDGDMPLSMPGGIDGSDAGEDVLPWLYGT